VSGGRDADVLIVGAGPAGGVLALRLVRAGFDVVCLEQGAWHDPVDFPAARPEFEVLARSAWSPDPNVRAGDADYPIDDDDSDVTPLMFNGVGGSTLLYAADWCRMRPSDFACARSTMSATTGRSTTTSWRRTTTAPTSSSGSAAWPAIPPCPRRQGRPTRRCPSVPVGDASPTPTIAWAGTGGPGRTP